jgi:hypothetical protein
VAEKRAAAGHVEPGPIPAAGPSVEANPLAEAPVADPGTDSEWLAEPSR